MPSNSEITFESLDFRHSFVFTVFDEVSKFFYKNRKVLKSSWLWLFQYSSDFTNLAYRFENPWFHTHTHIPILHYMMFTIFVELKFPLKYVLKF
uniref:Uncharacterized protein n=1 Tax=Octopus bimaculoides TaxID=37653 RepID=A0A0L8FNS4_OCTBM